MADATVSTDTFRELVDSFAQRVDELKRIASLRVQGDSSLYYITRLQRFQLPCKHQCSTQTTSKTCGAPNSQISMCVQPGTPFCTHDDANTQARLHAMEQQLSAVEHRINEDEAALVQVKWYTSHHTTPSQHLVRRWKPWPQLHRSKLPTWSTFSNTSHNTCQRYDPVRRHPSTVSVPHS